MCLCVLLRVLSLLQFSVPLCLFLCPPTLAQPLKSCSVAPREMVRLPDPLLLRSRKSAATRVRMDRWAQRISSPGSCRREAWAWVALRTRRRKQRSPSAVPPCGLLGHRARPPPHQQRPRWPPGGYDRWIQNLRGTRWAPRSLMMPRRRPPAGFWTRPAAVGICLRLRTSRGPRKRWPVALPWPAAAWWLEGECVLQISAFPPPLQFSSLDP